MQSLDAKSFYKNSLTCAASIVKDEGVFTLWSGAMPRLARLILSGGIVFTMFVLPDDKLSFMLTLRCQGTKKLWRVSIPSTLSASIYERPGLEREVWVIRFRIRVGNKICTILEIQLYYNTVEEKRLLLFQLLLRDHVFYIAVHQPLSDAVHDCF
jgi:hypothetical protein